MMKRSRFLFVLYVFASLTLISSCKKPGAESVSVRIGNIIVADRNLGVDVPKGGVALNYTNDTTHADHKNLLFKGDYYTWEEAKTACPSGWRLPTKDELEVIESKLKLSDGQFYLKGGYGERCYFPSSGRSNLSYNWNNSSFPDGYYWSSTEHVNKYDKGIAASNFSAWLLYVSTISQLGGNSEVRAEGMMRRVYRLSVRCVKTVE